MIRCFACNRVIDLPKPAKVVVTSDGAQLVYVGPDCYKLVVQAGATGYQPPRGGPRLFIQTHRRYEP